MILSRLVRLPRGILDALILGRIDLERPARPWRTLALDAGLFLVLFYFTFSMLLADESALPPRGSRVVFGDEGIRVTHVFVEAAPDWRLALAAFGSASPVLLLRRRPLWAWRYATVAIILVAPTLLLVSSGPITSGAVIAYVACLYRVATLASGPVTVGVGVLSLVAVGFLPENWQVLTYAPFVVPGVLALGYNIRRRRQASGELAVEHDARALLAERARIARELHDVIAHHVSVIAIQAEAVPLQAGGDRAKLESGLASIRELSLEALKEMRRALGVLRDEGGAVDTAPQPGLDRLGELAENARRGGLTVELPAEIPEVPAAVGLSAYRIVQESLSNAMRHSPGSRVLVRLTRTPDALTVVVANGGGSRTGVGSGEGQGLIGMRERAAMLGGTLTAGPVPGGGYEVRATLPCVEEA
ncbi:sensor histidine kinase [Acrocarpospora catenulata]|uniref:sensor histidine kinase n=1 Tax=Acrocarpospora catenulata TaxID=2836182 RepID=UPI001BDB2196|nr:histidine kinase [Acrocarpospora catenulata]